MFNSKTISHRRFIAALTILVAGALLAQFAFARNHNTAPPSVAALQQILPWTAVASTGAVDEADLGEFAFTGARVGFRPGAADPQDRIVVRYNVANPNRFEPTPGWTTLELTSAAPGGSTVQASLIRVEPCTGQELLICTAVNPGSNGPVCNNCPQFAASDIDFANYLYYVQLTLQAGEQPPPPVAHALRLLP